MGNNSNLSKLFNSSIGMVIGFAISGFLGMLTRIILGRLLQPEKYGMLSEGLAILNFFVIFSLLGTSEGIARFKSFGEKYYNSLSSAVVITVPLSIFSSVIVYLGSGLFSEVLGNPGLEPVFKIFAINIPALVMLSLAVGVFRGNKKTKERVLISDFFSPAMILILSVLLVKLIGTTPQNAALGYILAGWLSALIAVTVIIVNGNRFDKPELSQIRGLLDYSSPIMVASLFSFGFVWSNILILGYLLGSESAGLYNAAYPLTYAIGVLLSSVSYLFLPIASTVYSKKDYVELENIYHTATRWLIVTSLPIFALLAFRPEFLISFLFGQNYTSAASLLIILGIARITNVSFGPLGQLLMAFGETKKEAFSRGFGLLVLLSISIAMIPKYGLISAGFAYLTGVLITNILRLFFARTYSQFNPFNSDTLKPLLAFLIPLPLLLIAVNGLLPNLLSILLYGLSYALVLLSLKPFKEEDINIVNDLLEEKNLNKRKKEIIVSVLKRFKE